MQVVVNNTKFSFDIGCRLLKLKHDTAPFEEMEGIWDDVVPLTFKEIAQFTNIEERRVGILCLGLDRLIAEVNPELVNTKTLKKETNWVNQKGELVNKQFKDTYELYKVKGEYLSGGIKGSGITTMPDSYYVKCKDTSTDRVYLIWVDLDSVQETNKGKKLNAIQCVAWTIMTNVPKKQIEKIIRQGDCILIKPKEGYSPLDTERHLTEEEYKELLVAES